eukprot:scaffold2.g6954.t1
MGDLLDQVKAGGGSWATAGAAAGGGGAPGANGAPPPPGGRGGADVEAGVADVPDRPMEDFFKEVSVIKGLMADIRRNQGRLQEAHERSKTVTRSAEMKELREQMQADINAVGAGVARRACARACVRGRGRRADVNAVSKSADAIKKKLKDLDHSNEQALKKKGYGPGSSSERTRSAITGALKKKLKDLMAEFQDLRSRVNAEYREVVERRVYTVTGQHADEEQIDRMIDSGESETIFQKAILEQGRGYVLDTLAEIRERRDAIFLDMAVLVEAQGEMLDNIEAQVARSVEFVQSGTTHLQAAKQHQRRMRKWMCFGIILLVARALEHVEQGTQALRQAKAAQRSGRKWLCCGLVVAILAIAITCGIVFGLLPKLKL